MIKQIISLPKYNWLTKIYYATDTYNPDEIFATVKRMGCSGDLLRLIKEILYTGEHNQGFIYTTERFSVIFIGIQDCPLEFVKTYAHEKGHLAMHISLENKIDPYSEDFLYLVQEIASKLFKVGLHFMCDHCRKEMKL